MSILVLLVLVSLVHATNQCPINSIYQFGDSIADTGNLIRSGPVGAKSHAANYPYGQTYFHRATGRFSNGQLMIDYLAHSLRLPLLNPYLNGDTKSSSFKNGVNLAVSGSTALNSSFSAASNQLMIDYLARRFRNPYLNGDTKSSSFKNGVNFAVSGSTALNSSFFASRNLLVPATNTPLATQLAWFKSHLRSTCHGSSSDCLKQSLFMIGEIGGNDYSYGFFQGKTMEEIRSYIPHVVGAITAAARDVIRAGAVNVVVPGHFPVGCFPIYLTSFPVKDPKAYDENGCLKHLNEFVMDHNKQLQEAIASLRKEFPEVVIIYGDHYYAYQSFLRSAGTFDKSEALKSCCGIGGVYNYDGKRQCGAAGVPVCQNPGKFISWDGVHLTQRAYRLMSKFLNNQILSQIKCIRALEFFKLSKDMNDESF